jgi:hypothetical protein
MTSLAEYQRLVATTLASPDPPAAPDGPDMRGADVSRWSVHQWAAALLRNVCPLTGRLLVMRGRYGADVTAHLARGGRPSSLHAWGRSFLAQLTSEHDSLVADVALLELAMTAPIEARPGLPEPWVWDRDPWQVAAAIAHGTDPATLPLASAPILVYRNADGRLASAFA